MDGTKPDQADETVLEVTAANVFDDGNALLFVQEVADRHLGTVERDPDRCPACGGEWGYKSMQSDTGTIYQNAYCDSCPLQVTFAYQLDRIAVGVDDGDSVHVDETAFLGIRQRDDRLVGTLAKFHGDHVQVAAFGLLRLIGENPSALGRIRAGRIVTGRAVPGVDLADEWATTYAVMAQDAMPLRDVLELVDAMISGGLIHRTSGPRPALVLTRAGHHALDALNG